MLLKLKAFVYVAAAVALCAVVSACGLIPPKPASCSGSFRPANGPVVEPPSEAPARGQ